MINIYCAGPIKGDTTFQKYYQKIIDVVIQSDNEAFSELNPKIASNKILNDREIFLRDVEWLKNCNLMIAEVSGPSLGVGFEISYALYELKIPVLALSYEEVIKVSAMITGCDSELLTYKTYWDEEELNNIIHNFLNKF